jgi:hypothetical protein
MTTTSRNSAFYQQFLQLVEDANPVGDIYVITDNLSPHNSVSARTTPPICVRPLRNAAVADFGLRHGHRGDRQRGSCQSHGVVHSGTPWTPRPETTCAGKIPPIPCPRRRSGPVFL